MTEQAPLTPAEADLRNYPFTPMFRSRLFGSSFHARVSDSGWRAGVTLWLKSWDQVPAGSLPDDDIDLCRLAELGRDRKTWEKLKTEALWGWFKCNDGRLYHHVVAEGVNEAWQSKLSQRDRTRAARATKQANRLSQDDATPVTESVTGSNRQENRQEIEKQESSSDARAKDEAEFAELARLLAFDGNDHKNWLEFISMKTRHGLDYVAHILPAAQHHKAVGKTGKGLAYIRPKAIELREQSAVMATAPVVFEDCDDGRWGERLKFYMAHPEFDEATRWPLRWGPVWTDPSNKIPPDVLARFKIKLNGSGNGAAKQV